MKRLPLPRDRIMTQVERIARNLGKIVAPTD